MAYFYTQFNLSLSNFVPNYKILSQVVSEKSLIEKKTTDRYTNIVTEKAKTIYPYILLMPGYNDAAVAKVAAVAVVNNDEVAVVNVAVAVVNVAEATLIYVVEAAVVNVAAVAVVNANAISVIKVAELTDYLPKLVVSKQF